MHPVGGVPSDLKSLLRAALFGVLDGETPVCCGFFIGKTTAITVCHDTNPKRGAVIHARSFSKPPVDHRFTVVSRNSKWDYVVLRLDSETSPDRWLATPEPTFEEDDALGQAFIVTIALGIRESFMPGTWRPGLKIEQTWVDYCEGRHVHYNCSPGKGDSGGAIVRWNGTELQALALAMHVFGCNEASPTAEAAFKAQSPVSKRFRSSEDSDVGSSVSEADRRLYQELVSKLTTGGIGLYLGNDLPLD
jgi:hypothetical protein